MGVSFGSVVTAWMIVAVGLSPNAFVLGLTLVGLGSVCRRQATGEAGRIIRALHARGVRRLHGFGFKILGLAEHGHLLTSADSMAWSIDARRRRTPLPGCVGHRNCANCLRFALRWRTEVLAAARADPDPTTRKEAA